MKKHRLPAAVLALAALGFTLGTCEFVIVGILPDIAAGLNVSLAAVGRLVSVFAACYAVGTPLLTALTGRMDRFRLLMGLMLLFLGVNVLSMLAPGVTVLYASRVVAALVSGTLTAVAMLYAKEVSSQEQTARAISAVYAGFSVAAVAGVPIGTAARDGGTGLSSQPDGQRPGHQRYASEAGAGAAGMGRGLCAG